MLEIEKMKRASFLSALEEADDITIIISTVSRYLNNKEPLTDEKLNIKTLEYIKYLLDNDLFEVGDDYYDFKKWPLSIEQTLDKIKTFLHSGESLVFAFYFNLSAKGKAEADKYFDLQQKTREKILLLCESNYVDIPTIISIVKEEFKTEDKEEIELEFINCVSSLTDWYFIEPGVFQEEKFKGLGRFHRHELRKLFHNFEPKEEYINKKRILFHITPKGNKVLKEWRDEGERLSSHFDNFLGLGDLEEFGSLCESANQLTKP